MDNTNEGTQAPAVSDTAKEALESLAKQGFEIEGKPSNVEAPEPKPEANPEKTEEKQEVKPEAEKPKVNREPAVIPAWKQKIEEKRWEKEKETMQTEFNSKLASLQQKVEELSNRGVSQESKDQFVKDEIEEMATEFGLDETNKKFFKKFEQTILSKIKIPEDLTSKVTSLEEERNQLVQDREFEKEFESDVLPTLGEVSSKKLSEIKSKLKVIAFTEEYRKIPLRKVLRAEADEFQLDTPHKKSGEVSKSGQNRATDTVDFNNMDEDTFSRLSPEQKLEFSKSRTSDRRWN